MKATRSVFLVIAIVVEIGCKPPNDHESIVTRKMLIRIGRETEGLWIAEHHLPTGGLKPLLQKLEAEGAFDRECKISFPGITRGLDGWGREIVLAKSRTGLLAIWSRGANGLDEGGKGDDILIEIKLTNGEM